MDWIIEFRDGMWVVVCAGVVDSRWHSEASATARMTLLAAGRETMAELVAAAGDQPEGRPFYAVLAVDEYEAADGRYFEHFEWATVPLTLWTLDDQGMGGHQGAEASGSIRTVERLSDGRRIFATGFLGTTEEALQTEQQIEQLLLRFVSVDPADYDADWEVVKIDRDGWPVEDRLRFTNYVIGGATVLGNPAIRLACIWLEGMDAPSEFSEPLPDAVAATQIPEVVDANEDDIIVIMASAAAERGAPEPLTAAAYGAAASADRALLAAAAQAREASACQLTRECGGPALPPADWYQDPRLSGPSPLTVTPDGRVYGHVALWDVPHRGFLHYQWGEKIYAPHSHQAYAQFLTKSTIVACCDDAGCGHERQVVRTGNLTVGTSHAGKRLTAAAAIAHYENTGLAIASVTAGEDAHGIWVAGALYPDRDDARVREFLGAAPSGDWRYVGGHLELTACLMVNSEGFPVIASAFVDDGEVLTLLGGWNESVDVEDSEALIASLSSRPGPRPSEQARASRTGPTLEVELGVGRAVAAIEEVLDRRLGPIEADLALLRPQLAEKLAQGIEAELAHDRMLAALAAVRS